MKDPCIKCPKDKSCKQAVCEKWVLYIRSLTPNTTRQTTFNDTYMKEWMNMPILKEDEE